MKNPSTLYARMNFERLTGLPAIVFRSNQGSMRDHWTISFNVPDNLKSWFESYYETKGIKKLFGIQIEFLSYYHEHGQTAKAEVNIRKDHLIEAVATVHTEKEIEAFREGVKWGLTLYAYNPDGTKYLVGQKGHELEYLKADVDAGKWDSYMDRVNDNLEA